MIAPLYVNGEPDNLEAAALDALEWLRFWQWYLQEKELYWGEYNSRLDRAIVMLERYLPAARPEFRTKKPQEEHWSNGAEIITTTMNISDLEAYWPAMPEHLEGQDLFAEYGIHGAPESIQSTNHQEEQETMSTEAEAFEGHAIVELMGHNVIAGYVSQQVIAGVAMLRVDVPEVNGRPAFTKYFGGAAIYAITPTTKELAEVAARQLRVRPVTPWVVPDRPALPQPSDSDGEEYEDDYEDDREDSPF